MQTLLFFEKRVVRLFLIFAILAGCLSLCAYLIYREVEYQNCYKRLGVHYQVDPSYEHVSQAILAKLKLELIPGMEREQVIVILNGIAATKIISHQSADDGSYYEKIELQVCNMSYSDIYLIVSYTKVDLMKDIRIDHGS